MQPESNSCELDFRSLVPSHMRHDVEHLFFFNARQSILMSKIRAAVEDYGTPEIIEDDGTLRIGVRGRQVQCLFACDRAPWPALLVGVVLFLRTQRDCLSIIHMAVDDDYAHHPGHADAGVGVALIQEVRRIAHQIKGVRRVELPYQPGRFLPV